LIDGLFSRTPISIKPVIFLPPAARVRFDSAISSFESQPTKFVSPRSQGKITPHRISASHQTLAKTAPQPEHPSDPRKPLNPCKIAPQPELNGDGNSGLGKVG
jgi:hypothetical protein